MFSTLFLSFIAAISLYCFLLLVKTREVVPASFGDIGGVLFGKHMRMLVLVAITTSQVILTEKEWNTVIRMLIG